MPISKVLFLAQSFDPALKNGTPKKVSDLLGRLAPAVAGFVSASVKWRPKGKFLVNSAAAPAFLGEHPPAMNVEGAPAVAQSIAKSAEASGLWAETTEEWGLDPGHWQPLSLLDAREKITVIPVSLSQMSPEAHRKWGVAVRRGVQKHPDPMVLVVSGSLSFRADLTDRSDSQVEAFDREVMRVFTEGPLGKLDEVNRNLFNAAQPEGGWGSLYFLWGVLGDKTTGSLEFYERPRPGVASAALTFAL